MSNLEFSYNKTKAETGPLLIYIYLENFNKK